MAVILLFGHSTLWGGDMNILFEKLEKGYQDYIAFSSFELIRNKTYVEEMEHLTIESIYFESEIAKENFYNQINVKRDNLYSYIFETWKVSELKQLEKKLKSYEGHDFLYIGARDYLRNID